MLPKPGARTPKFDQALSFSEAVKKLNLAGDSRGRGLRAMVLAREKQTGKQIAIRLNGLKQPKLRVTVGALCRAFPELMAPKIDRTAEMFAPMLERAKAAIRAEFQREISAYTSDRIASLERRLLKLEKAVAARSGASR